MDFTRSYALILFLAVPAVADCPKGTTPYKEGVCTADIQPEADMTPAVKPSNEKPPRNSQPAYERSDVKIIDIKPESTVDDEIAAAKAEDARLASQGKKP
jgi:hypothetical protein